MQGDTRSVPLPDSSVDDVLSCRSKALRLLEGVASVSGMASDIHF